jgi:hypothetical protein
VTKDREEMTLVVENVTVVADLAAVDRIIPLYFLVHQNNFNTADSTEPIVIISC